MRQRGVRRQTRVWITCLCTAIQLLLAARRDFEEQGNFADTHLARRPRRTANHSFSPGVSGPPFRALNLHSTPMMGFGGGILPCRQTARVGSIRESR
jgi:hypothetical protein